MTKNSMDQSSNNQTVNPALDQLDPATFEVAAKKHSTLWKTEQYKAEEFRSDLTNTTNRIAQNNLPE